MRLSHRGLYALEALLHLAGSYGRGLATIHEIAETGRIPEKFLEGILLALRNARVVESHRGREGGYRLRVPPNEIRVGDVVRAIDGPLAPFADGEELVRLVQTDDRHAGLFDLLLEVRNTAAAILDHTTLADLQRRNRRVLASHRRRPQGGSKASRAFRSGRA